MPVLGGCGRKIAWGQMFQTILANIVRFHLCYFSIVKKKKKSNCQSPMLLRSLYKNWDWPRNKRLCFTSCSVRAVWRWKKGWEKRTTHYVVCPSRRVWCESVYDVNPMLYIIGLLYNPMLYNVILSDIKKKKPFCAQSMKKGLHNKQESSRYRPVH